MYFGILQAYLRYVVSHRKSQICQKNDLVYFLINLGVLFSFLFESYINLNDNMNIPQ